MTEHHHFKSHHMRKFLILCFLMGGYTLYLCLKYDVQQGGISSILTWSFFVLCTPIADAGFLLDFPIRLLMRVPMIISEIFVWALAILVNIVGVYFFADYYQTTELTQIFYHILVTPIPYWSIILLSGVGTFLSLYFGDVVLDSLPKDPARPFYQRLHLKNLMPLLLLFIAIIVLYYFLLQKMDIHLTT